MRDLRLCEVIYFLVTLNGILGKVATTPEATSGLLLDEGTRKFRDFPDGKPFTHSGLDPPRS